MLLLVRFHLRRTVLVVVAVSIGFRSFPIGALVRAICRVTLFVAHRWNLRRELVSGEPSKGFLICTVCVCVCVLSPYLRTWLVQLADASRTERRVCYIIFSRGGKLTPVEASDNSNLAATVCLAECRRVYFLVRVQARVHANSAPEFKGALAACGAAFLESILIP